MRTVLSNCCFLAFLSAASFACAQDTASPDKPTEAEIQGLIEQLAQSEKKKDALKRLVEIGEPASAFLKSSSKHRNKNVRTWAQIALRKITARAKFEHALQQFVKDGELPEGIKLPGWKHYVLVAGNDQTSRELYAQMYKLDRELLEAYATNPRRAAKLFESLYITAVSKTTVDLNPIRPRPNVLEETALLFLVAGDKRINVDDWQGGSLLRLVWNIRSEPVSLLDFTNNPAFRKLVGKWVSRSFKNKEVKAGTLAWQVMLAWQFDLKEGAPKAKEWFLMGGKEIEKLLQVVGLDNKSKIDALTVLGKIGSQADRPFLEPLLDDTTSCGLFGTVDEPLVIEVRDAALAALVQITGQNLDDYHISTKYFRGSYWPNFFFESAKDRSAALAKWNAWAKENPIKNSEEAPH